MESEAKYPHESPFRPPNPMKRDAVGCLMGGIPEFLGKIHGHLSADGRITACPAVGWAKMDKDGLEWFRKEYAICEFWFPMSDTILRTSLCNEGALGLKARSWFLTDTQGSCQ